MSLDVVGVTVEAVFVVGHDDLGRSSMRWPPAISRVADRGRPERVGVVVLRPAHHAGVAISQSYESTDAENLYRLSSSVSRMLRYVVGVVAVLARA